MYKGQGGGWGTGWGERRGVKERGREASSGGEYGPGPGGPGGGDPQRSGEEVHGRHGDENGPDSRGGQGGAGREKTKEKAGVQPMDREAAEKRRATQQAAAARRRNGPLSSGPAAAGNVFTELHHSRARRQSAPSAILDAPHSPSRKTCRYLHKALPRGGGGSHACLHVAHAMMRAQTFTRARPTRLTCLDCNAALQGIVRITSHGTS